VLPTRNTSEVTLSAPALEEDKSIGLATYSQQIAVKNYSIVIATHQSSARFGNDLAPLELEDAPTRERPLPRSRKVGYRL